MTIRSAYVVEFSEISEKRVVDYVCDRMKSLNLHLSLEEANVVLISCARKELETLAHAQGLLKPTKTGNTLESFTLKDTDMFKDYQDSSFFLPCEEMALLWDLLSQLTTCEKFNSLLPKGSQHVSPGADLLSSCKRMGIIQNIVPLHTAERKAVWKACLWASPFSWEAVDTIRNYYGNKVALYFAWMTHFTRWLIAPGVIGFVLWLYNSFVQDLSMDNSTIAPLFTIFIIVWAASFIQFWKRKCASLCCKWGNTFHQLTDHARPEFKGELRVCVITGRQERYFAHRYRVLRYVGSSIVTACMLLVAFFVMILSLNFQGYVHPNTLLGSRIHFPLLHQFSLPGAIFDQSGHGPWPWILPYVPCIIHSATILLLNSYYRGIAIRLTNWENHRLQEEYEDALLIKRFCFEAFDCYIALFYLAFCQNDIILLKNELVSLYTMDSLRRVVTESVLPLLLQRVDVQLKKSDDKVHENQYILDQLRLLDSYDQFDDYMEMVIEFGYVALFASAFPLASILSILCNIIEFKSDLFKLTYVHQRPEALHVESIGRWLSVLSFIVWLSVLTNVFIFGFTSGQMMQFMPSLFESSAHRAALGQGRWVVGYVFLFEHVLLIVVKLIFTAIPDSPQKVDAEIKRRELRWHQLLMKQRK